MNAMRAYAVPAAAVLCAALLCGCSIFDLKEPAPPLVGVKTEDPLNIGDILSIAGESAADMDYSDYFAADVTFEYTLFRTLTGRGEVINMLNRLRAQASLVEWQPQSARTRFEVNLLVVENMPYTVYFGGKAICAGFADFHIVRGPEWLISYWKDVPDGGHVPFFEP
jgi:hypothetical protein